ncbi:MAG: DUF2130 domain-containing protein [Atopobiaceae bacterium]|nr:DUF2130 domain-containing protein [Atopobiaceae bacterium]
MAQIKCPHCGMLIDVDPSKVEDLARQLRDDLFSHDLEARLSELGQLHDAQIKTAREEERREADRRVAKAGEQVAQLQAKLDAAEREQQLAVQREQTKAAEEQASLQRKLGEERLAAQAKAAQAADEARQREANLNEEVSRLKAQLSAQEETLKAQSEAEVLRATAQLERSCGELQAQLKVEQANGEKAQADLREEMARREEELQRHVAEQLAAKDERIVQYQEDIKRLRDYRMSLSTKLIGESLERHCESEFNRIRMQAYPNATFEKDNEAVGGTKGDFIFRDFDEEGNELLSIMFEMKNEEEQSAASSRKRNEDHFKKLDSDRTKKNCEYAVLVSTLDPENDFYNAGIADVSWQYPKMFVVRPQCFTTIIGLLKAAALSAHPYKMQLERAKQEEIDVTRFEERVTKIVDGIDSDYRRAAKNYETAEKDIDAIIAKLQHLKAQLGTAAKHFNTAVNRSERLAIKRLTYGNPTMKAAFAEAHEAAELDDATDELPADTDEPISPDALE